MVARHACDLHRDCYAGVVDQGMSDDVVDRVLAYSANVGPYAEALLKEAAAEIERLRNIVAQTDECNDRANAEIERLCQLAIDRYNEIERLRNELWSCCQQRDAALAGERQLLADNEKLRAKR